MFFNENIKEKMDKLKKESENFDTEANSFFEDLNISPDEIGDFLSNKDNFTDEQWETLQDRKQEIEENLTKDLENLPNPKKTTKGLKHLRNASKWLQV